MGISINKKIFFIILLLFFLSGCTQDNNTELISGEMSEQEIDSFFGDLELASYTIENQHYSKKNGSQIMDTRMLFGISANEYKIKLETFTSGSEEELKGEAIIIAGTNQEGEITQIKKYDFCTETAILGRMCMDMTTMGEELSKNIREQGISSKNSSRETITKFVGFKEILGEKARCFETNYAPETKAIICYHPKYFISLESDIGGNDGTIIKATKLTMGNIPDKEFVN